MCSSIRMSQKKRFSRSRVKAVKPSNPKLKNTDVLKKPIKSEPSKEISDSFTEIMEEESVATVFNIFFQEFAIYLDQLVLLKWGLTYKITMKHISEFLGLLLESRYHYYLV